MKSATSETSALDVATMNTQNVQMFKVFKQNHIAKPVHRVQLQVGDMGITFYDMDMKPVDSIRYEKLQSWELRNPRSGSNLLLKLKTPDRELQEVVLKTPDGEQIMHLMETKAR